MKIKLLCALAVTLLGCTVAEAQQLIIDDFDQYGPGDLGFDLTGVQGGQGNWKIYASLDGQLSDFQIREETGRGNVMMLTSPHSPSNKQYDNAKYAWKDLPTNAWKNRNTGNDKLSVEYEFFTGNATASDSYHRNVTYGSNGTFIAGYQYEPATRRLRGMTRLELNGEVKLQMILLGPNQGDLFLPPDSWVQVVYQVDYATNEITFQVPIANVDGSIATTSLVNQPPVEIDFVSYMSEGNNYPTTVLYDNYRVAAVQSPSLKVDTAVSEKFSIYPNPVVDVLTIANSDKVSIELIKVFDLNGRTVQTENFKHNSAIQINLSRLNAGVYIVHITTNEGIAIKRVIKK